ncbi:POC1 centriolar protein A, partial [Entophlyctis luteolus]
GLQSLSDPVSAVSPQATATRYLIVIDALDECGTQGDPIRNELLSLLASLNTGFSIAAAKLPPFVKILTTGRPEADIWRVMESLRTDSLEPTAAANIRDIELFVQHEVAHFPYSLGHQTDKCCQLLTEYSEYVFVAARVLCSQVRTIVDSNHGVDRLDLVALVANLSASLDDQYARILDSNIKRNDIADLDVYMKFMYVLLAAKIPLDCANIAVLTDLMPAGVQLIISKLHSLLLISPDGKVTVLHKSVKDFLTSQARCTVPAFHVSLVKANVFVAQRCLAVLNDQLHHNIFGLPSVSEPVQPKKQELLSKLSPAWLEVMTVEKQLSQLMESCANLVKLMESVSGLEVPIQKLKPHNFSHTKDLHQVPDATGALAAAKDVSYTLITAGASYLSLARELLTDVARLAARFHPALDFNPLHIYQSALTFTPQQTKLCQLYHSLAGGKVTASPDLTWGPLVSSMFGHSDPVTSVAFNHDGSLIASGSRDKTVRVWNPLSGALVSELKGHSHHVNSVAFNHDGSLIATGCADETVRVWNPLSGALVSELKGHSHHVNSVAFNGSLIASGSHDSTVRVWNPLSGALVSELKGHSGWVRSVAFNHDGSLIASGSYDKTVQIWNPFSGALVSQLKGHSDYVNSVAFNHDGALIASGSADKTVRVWNTLSGTLVSELKGHSGWVQSVAFNHDSALIASGSADKTIRLWNPLSGALVSVLEGYCGGSVKSLAFQEFQEPPADSALQPSLKFSDNSGWLGLGSASSKLLWVPLAPSLEYAFSHSAFACGFPDGKIVICVLQSPK